MAWCNDNPSSVLSAAAEEQSERAFPPAGAADGVIVRLGDEFGGNKCPSCGHDMESSFQDPIQDLPGLPAGMKFDPTDQEILGHLEAKVMSDSRKIHPLIDEFIPTIDGENGICYTHPEKLPGVSNDGQIRHFFHRPSKAYTTGTRKRRKVHTEEDGSETRWHKTGKTRPVLVGGATKGFKKILVLYTNYGRQRKPEKTNWVMHQYHLGNNEEEKDGELVVSKVFYQTQPRQCGNSNVQGNRNIITINSGANTATATTITSSSTLVDYYSPTFMGYDHENSISDHQGSHINRESPPQLIPNLVVHQGDGSSYIRLAGDTSKGKLQRK
ncbi:unnamed protein product [Linum tenue]|uniref:NAC domain-containing protein n=1 Tax=Linum tenue TaxID=586396 RepID=A0AAV0PE48_9ROSI|nr:unnamed protein product [Linum tenue]